ncbi:histidine triad nucleotide-binding protein [Clostridium botulinum]|uniref:Nucleotide-binding protein n=1 Tax=Clostridium botulinum (strain Hall / ATCC 3502 / NCTC 13319 / Type A) TaxID=441771 RepID=A5I635_CLOBH|nr:histidine triad nucleotide-binding protein [Clostridium botulinum]EPS48195.1 HIT family protein [Clostridium botulinum CFSAN002369]ABS33796.1 HIT family protein [Clostridium botulinum A str. ATCC 19397]ABS37561.1 HIT family protein [Clostridium botulinum A str. Hall]APQ74254.1 HIT domain protein [Clostridium botulinum]APQ97140.1 HIT domain protein [Clostridium botulinum]
MENCIFCKILKGEIPSSKVYEDELVYAFNDIDPVAPHHVLIIPKEHISSLNELTEENSKVISHIFMVAKKIAKDLNISEEGYRVISNCGESAGQTVFHIHFHLIAGRNLQWPPG